MFNTKLLGIVAGIGFLLSFIVGLTAGVSFGMLLLRAFLSGIACAALAFAIDQLYKKFLIVSSEDINTSAPTVGSVVDVTLDDEDLPEDQNGPSFYVSGNHNVMHKNVEDIGDTSVRNVSSSLNDLSPQNLSSRQESPLKSNSGQLESVLATSSTSVSSFDSNVEKNNNDSFKAQPIETISSSNVNEHVETNKKVSPSSEIADVDDLPDLTSLVPEFKTDDVSVVKDSQFAIASSKDNTEGSGDAQVMAQAIRTILSQDS